MNTQKFTINAFREAYGTNDKCLELLWQQHYGDLKVCPNPSCKRETTFHRITTKLVYGCKFCGYQISPIKKTPFKRSHIQLKDWFYAMYMFGVSKNGVSAKELERTFGLSYKSALRMTRVLRTIYDHSKDILENKVEFDETYQGGKGKNNKRGRGAEHKTPIFGMVERKGSVIAKVVADTKRKTVMPIIRDNVKIDAQVMTDEYLPYQSLTKEGYRHQTVNHGSKEYVRGDVHTNTIEGFWSQLKRSINGTHHAVSPKHLQSYVNEFAWKYNTRNSQIHMFHLMLEEFLKLA